MTIYTAPQRPEDTGELARLEMTQNLTAYRDVPPVMRRPEAAAETLVITIVRAIDPPLIDVPLIGLPIWEAPPPPASIVEDLGPTRPPFGERGCHRRPSILATAWALIRGAM
jgi:hypothetical protein